MSLILAAALLLLPALPEPPAIEERVEVRATLPGDDPTAFRTVLATDEIAERGQDLATVLRRVPGARVRDYGGLGGYATVSLRGSTSEQVAVFVDGVPQNRALGGPVDLSSIPATQLSEIRVYRGFGPASLGLGGMGGVVDVRTAPPGGTPAGQVDLLYGGLETARLSTGWSFPAGPRGSVRIGAESTTSDGAFSYLDSGGTYGTTDDDVVRLRENNDLRSTSILLQGGWDVGVRDRLGAIVRVRDLDRGVPGPDSHPAYDTRLEENGGDLTVSWSRQGRGAVDSMEVQGNAFVDETRFADPEGELGLGVQDETTDVRGGGVATIARGHGGAHAWLARLDLRRQDARVTDDALTVPGRGGATRDFVALTLEDTITIGRSTIAPAIRGQYRRDDFHEGGAGTLPPRADDRNDTNLSGKLGLAHDAGGGWTVRGSVGRFYRVPSLQELFGDRGTVVGNPALLPEDGWSAEAGFEHTGRMHHVEVALFGRDADNLIVFVPNSQSTAVARNLGGAEIRGVETLASVLAARGLRLEGSVTYQRSENRSGGPADGKPVVGMPTWLAYGGVAWDPGPVSMRWEVHYVGENSYDLQDTPYLRVPARTIHDASAHVALPRGFRVGVDVRNVLDRDTRDIAGFPLPGRVALAYVGWRLEEARP